MRPTSSVSAAAVPRRTRSAGEPPARDLRVECRGLTFHVRETGRSTAPAVVVLHGIMGHGREWDTMAEALAPDHRVLVVEQRGHGRSSWADRYTAAAMADDVVSVLDVLGLSGVPLVGHSMGGMAGLLAASRNDDHVERLVLVDVGPEVVAPGEHVEGLVAFLTELGAASYATLDEAVGPWQEGDPLARPELLRHYTEHNLRIDDNGRYRWRFDAEGLVGFMREGTTPGELWAAVDRVQAPVLVVRGEHSPFLSSSHAQEVVDRLADGSIVEIPGGGHDLGVQQPEAVASAVRSFIADRSR